MADLYVDVDALTELSRQLQQVKASLERVSDDMSPYIGRLGPSRIEGGLGDFVDGWRDGRKKLIEGIDGLLGRIQGAVDMYSEQEKKLSEAAKGSS
jgi:hypothetical protein